MIKPTSSSQRRTSPLPLQTRNTLAITTILAALRLSNSTTPQRMLTCNLQLAIRRAPAPKLAPGFYQAVHKLFVVVELLMGDIPERSLFQHPVLEKALRGYFDIVKGEPPASHCSPLILTCCSGPHWLSFAIPKYPFDTSSASSRIGHTPGKDGGRFG
jgi:hypothetical protein